MPDISIPIAVVRTPYPGASAEAVEQEVTRRVEEAVNTVNGIRTIRSGSRAGLLRGWWSSSSSTSTSRPRSRTCATRWPQARRPFNRDVGEPTVSRADNDNDQPVIYLSLLSDARSLREVSDLAELLVVKRLQGAAGRGQRRGERRRCSASSRSASSPR